MSTQSVGSPNQTMAELQPPNMTMTSSLSCSPNSSISDALDQTTVPSSTVDNGSSAAAIRAPSSVVHPASDPEDQTPTDSYPSLGIEQQEEEEDDDDEDKVPLDLVRLTFLLVSGNRHALDFEPTTLVHQVKEHLLSHWPDDLKSQRAVPESTAQLEILYLGKFLENNSSLESNRLNAGNAFTVHLLIRDPRPKSSDDSKGIDSVPRCKCCIIL